MIANKMSGRVCAFVLAILLAAATFFSTASGSAHADGTDLAFGKTTSSSSEFSSAYVSGYAVDGSTSTRWSSIANLNPSEWWSVDLGSVQSIGRVTTVWSSAYASAYTVATSTDGSTFSTVKTITGASGGTTEDTFSAVNARYVKITMTGYAPSINNFSFFTASVYAGGTVNVLPTQFFAKVFSESVGRAPTQTEWVSLTNYFQSNACDVNTLKTQGVAVFGSAEFTGLGYTAGQAALTLYRAVLNREPDSSGFASTVSALASNSPAKMAALMFDTAEFSSLATSICSSTSPDYNFSTQPILTIPVSGPGFQGNEAALQSALNAAVSGSAVFLAQNAVIHLTSTLTIPAGVTLSTQGSPLPSHFAQMGRLVRDPGFGGATIQMTGGSHLAHVWVDGGRLRETVYDRTRFNVRTLGGDGTSVVNSRIGNSAGATNIENLSAWDGYPCSNNVITGNFIEAYTSSHTGEFWSDGISAHCEDVTISGNTVIDATDVGIIAFALLDGAAQHSQIFNNVVIQAGQSSFGMIGLDPYFGPGAGDVANSASRSAVGLSFNNNTIWTSTRVHSVFGMIVGTKAWFGTNSRNSTGGSFTNNTSGVLSVRGSAGIAVMGALNVTVTGNTISTNLFGSSSTCPLYAVGASVSSGFASGTIQTYNDALYSGCLSGSDGEG